MFQADALEQQTIGDALQSSPFSFVSLLQMAMGGGKGGCGVESGGGMGAAFNHDRAQASLDRGMTHNIYTQTA
jgi:hypothetical protein